ncbi:MAG: VOC family protein [Thermomicrobiales bacterium]
MTTVSIYLNFENAAEEAFAFYRQVFGTELAYPPFRYSDAPAGEDWPPVPDEQKNLIMNIAMPLAGGVTLMGADVGEGMGFTHTVGNNVQIGLHPETREEADRLYAALSEGGDARMPMADQFWGDYYGELVDQFGIVWLIFFANER